MKKRRSKPLLQRLRAIVKGDTEFDFSRLNEQPKEEESEIIHVAGPQIISRQQAQENAAQYLRDAPCIGWGGIRIPDKTHFLYVGMNRSGKSVLIKQLMQQVFSRFGEGTNHRAVIYDASTELISFLFAIVDGRIPIYIFDPQDERCIAWKISADIRNKDDALNLGQFIFPTGNEQSSKDEYFSEGPSTVMAGVINAFILINQERKKRREPLIDWTLRDVRLALSNDRDAKELLGKRPETREVIKYFDSGNPDLDRTVINKFDRLESTAARWHYSTVPSTGEKKREPVSLGEFLRSKDSAILVLGASSNVTIKAVNHTIFEKLAELMLDKSVPSETDSRTWLFLDEFSDIGKMETMGKLLSMGLKKGVRIVAAYQNIASVEKVYGAYDPKIIKSEIPTIAFLRQQGETAKNASDFIGEREIKRLKVSKGTSQTIGTFQKQYSENREYIPDKEPALHPAKLRDLPVAGEGSGVGGYFFTQFATDVFHHHFSWDELSYLANLKSEEPDFIPNNSEEDLRLEPWTPEERANLGLPPDPQQPQPQAAPNAPNESPADKILDALIEARVLKKH